MQQKSHPPSHPKDMQCKDEKSGPVIKLKRKYHQELPKKERKFQTPEVKKLL